VAHRCKVTHEKEQENWTAMSVRIGSETFALFFLLGSRRSTHNSQCRHIGQAGTELQPIRNCGTRRERDVSTTPRLLYPLERPGTCRKGGVKRGTENLACIGIRSPDRPARAESLYRPSYTGCCWETECLPEQDRGKRGDQCPLPPTSLASGLEAVIHNTSVRRL